MLYPFILLGMLVAIVAPSLIWAMLYRIFLRIGFQQPVMRGLLVVLAFQAIVVFSNALFTISDPISPEACLTAIGGMGVTLFLVLAEALILLSLMKDWPRASNGKKRRFKTWILLWLLFNGMAFWSHLSLATLCTV